MLNLDTHILLQAVEGVLDSDANSAMARDPRWGISDIVLWEIEMLHSRGIVARGVDDADVVSFLDVIEIWPIDREVCRQMRRLDFRSDPADEIIAATSLAHRVALVTRDQRLRGSHVLRCV